MAVHSPMGKVEMVASRPIEAQTNGSHPGGVDPDDDGRTISVLVVHDHDVVRLGFRLLLGRLPWVVRCLAASNAEEAMTLWNRYEPHVAVVDLLVGMRAGSDLCVALRRARPHGRVLLMSSSDRMTRGAAVAVGACGFIPTGAPAAAIAKAVRLAGMGRIVSQPPPAQRALLSERQRDVLQLIAAGRTNQQIGSKLGLSANTVKGHTCALYRRLEVRNRAEAVRRGQQVGLLT